jgi:intracellular sulfur oxidation DsrE/DsrF family protein
LEVTAVADERSVCESRYRERKPLKGFHFNIDKPFSKEQVMSRSVLPPLTLLFLLLAAWLSHGNDDDRYGVAFHVDSDTKMNHVLRQVGRHRAANHAMPTRVILIAEGVKAALDNATDSSGGAYSAQMEQLIAAGIRIFACETTLTSYGLDADDLALGIETIPSGVAELARLQISHQWAYIKL